MRSPSLRGNPALARSLEARLRGSPEVASVHADPASGSLLVVTRGDRPPPGVTVAPHRPAPAPRWAGRFRRRSEPPRATWHALSAAETLDRLGSSTAGLDATEARRRLRQFGSNTLEPTRPRSRLAILGAQLANVPSALLLGSSALSTALGEMIDAAAILTVVGLNSTIGYLVERTNEQLIASWQRAESGEARVLRDGETRSVSTAGLVPGDILLVTAGDVLPADARVVEGQRLACDEAALTGESEPQIKQSAPLAEDLPLADRANMLYAGTTVVTGHARAAVVATGADTELARVRALLERTVAPAAPLARRMNRLSNRVAQLSMLGAAATAVAGALHRRPAGEVLRGAVALGVAALPEGLPVVSTAALVRSMSRMRRDGMVVRRVSSAETLGGVTVICTDKTGTLTLNRMQLEVIDLGSGPRPIASVRADRSRLFDDHATLTLAAGVLNSDVEVHRRGHDILSISGSSTERALVLAAHAAGLDNRSLRRAHPTRKLLERSAGVHYQLSIHAGGLAFVKGAPEQVVALCDRRFDGAPLDAAALLAHNDALASDGLRVLGLAWRRCDEAGPPPDGGFTWLGMVGLRDPLRPGAADAVAAARRAGIRTVILTGDQRRTAEAIARQLGLDGDGDIAIDGSEVARLAASDDPADRQRLARLAVVSRVTPADKLAVVEALRRQGEIVAMAGDGINDAPALKVADVGIAVGRSASDLARHVADVVLAGEDLRAILNAVAEGRIVQDNLRRAVRFLFATNFSELALVLTAALAGARDPLTPMQLLWINLLTDTLPALALALEPGDRAVLDRPPSPPSAPILGPGARRGIVRDGSLMALASGLTSLVGGAAAGFGVLTGAQLAYTVHCRAAGTPPSPRFARLVGGTAAAQVAALSLAPLRRLIAGGASALGPLTGFGVGFALPWLVGRLGGGELIVYSGVSARRTPATGCVAAAAAPQP
jgi:Ca2+-transporting ATPase